MPCAHGIYPFTDANVEDFDSIFAELVRTSNDQPDILYRPDEYARPFFPMAEKLVATAEQAESKGYTAQARDLYLRAAAVYRIARFPINGYPSTSPDPLVPGPNSPALPEWTRNGSFLVFRRLRQNVALFWRKNEEE